jgi:hypothetical protein
MLGALVGCASILSSSVQLPVRSLDKPIQIESSAIDAMSLILHTLTNSQPE